jgi:hypothetical protein
VVDNESPGPTNRSIDPDTEVSIDPDTDVSIDPDTEVSATTTGSTPR